MSRKRKEPASIVHEPDVPKPLDIYVCVAAARVFAVPVQFVMGEEMYANWRRRTARLRRARITAVQENNGSRAVAINAALKRLTTGSME